MDVHIHPKAASLGLSPRSGHRGSKTRCAGTDNLSRTRVPPCIYALYSYPWLGGEKIRGLIRFAEVNEELSSEIVEEFRDGRYTLILVRIQKEGTVCPA